MSVYRLSLYKGDYNCLNFQDIPKDHQIVLGYADILEIETVVSFTEITQYNESKAIKGLLFYRYSLFLMDLPTETEELYLNNEELQKDNFFFVCPIKLNLPLCDGKSFEEDYTCAIKLICESLGVLDGNIKKQFFLSPGSFDLVLVAASHQVKYLHRMLQILRGIVIECDKYSKDKNSKKERKYLCTAVTSLLIVHPLISVSNEADACLCDVSVQLHFKTPSPSQNKLIEAVKGIIGDDIPFSVLLGATHGDCSLRFNTVALHRLFPLYGVGNGLDFGNKWWKENIRASNTYVYTESQNTEFVDELPIDPDNRVADILSIKLSILYDQINTLIPEVSQYTLKVLLDACRSLLYSKRNRLIGMKITVILINVMNIILAFPDLVDNKSIAKSLRDVALIADAAMQSDSIQMKHFDGEMLDNSAPLAKLSSGFEHILIHANDLLVQYEDTPHSELLLFLTMGHSSYIDSFFYLRTTDSKLPKLISTNLPNAQYYNSISFPFIYHEIGHYTALSYKDRTFRNEKYEQLIKYYMAWKISYYMDAASEYYNDVKAIYVYLNRFWGMLPRLVTEEITLDTFVNSVEEKIFKTADLIAYYIRKKNSQSGDAYKINSDLFYQAFCLFIQEARTVLNLFDLTFREAHADIVMSILGGLDARQYLRAMYNHMLVNNMAMGDQMLDNLVHPNEDNTFNIRLAAVVRALSGKDEDIINKMSSNMSCDEKDFFDTVINLSKGKFSYVEPLTDYLTVIYNKYAVIDRNNLPNFSGNESPDNIISFYMNHWYKNLTEWRRKADALADKETPPI